METAVYSPRSGVIADVLVTPGAIVDTKDLLIVIQ
jgi:biotin carboxyl carrier protein